MKTRKTKEHGRSTTGNHAPEGVQGEVAKSSSGFKSGSENTQEKTHAGSDAKSAEAREAPELSDEKVGVFKLTNRT